ncbi:hypothetical protein BD289DRAFT_420764 [Coniella lustricola]|uniref:Secreted protein n=1 Tax=Coniella lustricola TaxID=2025994 RepID=A0A2T3AMN2_9PEZI|nr:hypothetical protein BD289DRAFT_420764 [Coniella lustricola]
MTGRCSFGLSLVSTFNLLVFARPGGPECFAQGSMVCQPASQPAVLNPTPTPPTASCCRCTSLFLPKFLSPLFAAFPPTLLHDPVSQATTVASTRTQFKFEEFTHSLHSCILATAPSVESCATLRQPKLPQSAVAAAPSIASPTTSLLSC